MLELSFFSRPLAIAVAHRKPATSLIDLESLKLKTYSLSVYGASAFRIAVSVLPFLLPLFVPARLRPECLSIGSLCCHPV
jgi:hypothetical protein